MTTIDNAQYAPTVGTPDDALRARITGTWRLVSAFNYTNGAWVPAFGTPPSGYFIYGAAGYASVQIMTTPPVSLSDPANGPTPAEALQIVNNFISYYGPWSVDATNITVIPEGNLDPTQLGPDNPQARPYQLNGDTLIIGDQTTYIRTLERVRA
jgi:hypothetical protein